MLKREAPQEEQQRMSPDATRGQRARFAGELAFSLLGNKVWPTRNQYHTIAKGPRDHGVVVLSTYPVATEYLGMGGHHKEMYDKFLVTSRSGSVVSKIDLVIAALQDFELADEGVPYFPVAIRGAKGPDWRALGVSQWHQVKMLDHDAYIPGSEVDDALSPKEREEHNLKTMLPIIDAEVEAIQDTVKEGNTAVVHCKAGVGRSAVIVACWLVKHHAGGLGYTAAIKYLQDKRNQVNLNEKQLYLIKRYTEAYYKPQFNRHNVFSAPQFSASAEEEEETRSAAASASRGVPSANPELDSDADDTAFAMLFRSAPFSPHPSRSSEAAVEEKSSLDDPAPATPPPSPARSPILKRKMQ